MKNNYSATVKDNCLKVYINKVLHFSIKREDIIGFQSWVEGEDTQRFIIEFYTRYQTILVGYDDKDKWIKILNLIDKQDLYSHYSE